MSHIDAVDSKVQTAVTTKGTDSEFSTKGVCSDGQVGAASTGPGHAHINAGDPARLTTMPDNPSGADRQPHGAAQLGKMTSTSNFQRLHLLWAKALCLQGRPAVLGLAVLRN
ncbi:LOW QUALITY PROTEIN: hypothetical protein U0070_012900 [Myodes glareolus]|uniref:Uncharacterized protein n=1 Tax=Myodes glareolus TaxID=447135 RepID=A0AAW0IF80_MYOGA